MNGRRSFDILFTMTLVCAFVLVSLLLVAMGANLYKKSSENSSSAHELRTSVSYVANKITSDGADAVYTDTVDGKQCICIKTIHDDTSYTTYVYYAEGALCELVARDGTAFSLDFGEPVVELAGFTFSIEGARAALFATASDGSTRSLQVYLPRGGGK